MRILAFSDNHASIRMTKKILELAKDVDLLICAGDFSNFGSFAEVFLDNIASLKLPMYFIAGNHENIRLSKKLCNTYRFLIDINDKIFIIEDIILYGCSYWNALPNKAMDIINSFNEKKKKIVLEKEIKFIFVSHFPPQGTPVSITRKRQEGGSEIIKNFIKLFSPDLAICGHIHDPINRKAFIGNTEVWNLACEYKVFTI